MSLKSLIDTGTKVWLDGVEPDQIKSNRALGITGATSNPTIISQIIEKGALRRSESSQLIGQGLDDEAIAWALDDELVRSAQEVFLPVWEQTRGDDGYVSFELDPLIEDPGELAPARGAGAEIHRAWQEMVGRSPEPHDQGSRDGGGAGRAGGTRRRRRDASTSR